MTPFYTSKGDVGDTGFLGEGRISKSSIRIEALGSVDEATAAMGLARALSDSGEVKAVLLKVQKHLFLLMTELSSDPKNVDKFQKIDEDHIRWLEEEIGRIEKSVEMPKEFIIPGEDPASGALSLARTIVRRSERRVITLYDSGGITRPVVLAYLNRLSSLIFILEVYQASLSGLSPRLANKE